MSPIAQHVIVTTVEREGRAPLTHVYGGFTDRPHAQRGARSITAGVHPNTRSKLRTSVHKVLAIAPETHAPKAVEAAASVTAASPPEPEMKQYQAIVRDGTLRLDPVPEVVEANRAAYEEELTNPELRSTGREKIPDEQQKELARRSYELDKREHDLKLRQTELNLHKARFREEAKHTAPRWWRTVALAEAALILTAALTTLVILTPWSA